MEPNNITTAKQLLKSEESAIVLFTHGPHFEIKQDGTGSSGHWQIDPDMECDRVIVYYRKGQTNEIYLGNFINTKNAPDRKRQIILFNQMKHVGESKSNWYEFANGGQNPAQTVFGDE